MGQMQIVIAPAKRPHRSDGGAQAAAMLAGTSATPSPSTLHTVALAGQWPLKWRDNKLLAGLAQPATSKQQAGAECLQTVRLQGKHTHALRRAHHARWQGLLAGGSLALALALDRPSRQQVDPLASGGFELLRLAVWL